MTVIHLTPPQHKRHQSVIYIGAGMSTSLPSIIAEMGRVESIVVLYDQAIETIAKTIVVSLRPLCFLPVKSGDASKSLTTIEELAGRMMEAGVSRSTVIVCIGGGMITDLGGLLASIFMRGVSCIHIPTSLLGMVDASVGGKTGVNVEHRKNILGTISHPRAVIIDTDFLSTLPERQLREGMVEIVKIAAILSDTLFVWLEKHMPAVMERKPEALMHCIEEAVALKVRTVESDEADADVRLFLNFGHTVGHAVEALSGFTISHGEAVSIGMSMEMGIAQFSQRKRVEELLKQLAMPLAIPAEFTIDRLWKMMQGDKKNAGGDVRMAVPQLIGEGTVVPMTFERFSDSIKRS